LKSLAAKYADVLKHLRALPKTDKREQAIMRLEESAFYAACAAEMLGDPIAFLMGDTECPSTKRGEPS
jgi:hypothetical protein